MHEQTLIDPRLKTPDGKAAKAAHISLVESMAFSPDGKTLATGSFQELTLWDFAKGTPTESRSAGFADKVTCIAYSADGKFFATGGGAPTEDGEIKIFTAARQARGRHQERPHGHGVRRRVLARTASCWPPAARTSS